MTVRHNSSNSEDDDGLLTLRTLVILALAAGSALAVHLAGGNAEVAMGTLLTVAAVLHGLVGR